MIGRRTDDVVLIDFSCYCEIGFTKRMLGGKIPVSRLLASIGLMMNPSLQIISSPLHVRATKRWAVMSLSDGGHVCYGVTTNAAGSRRSESSFRVRGMHDVYLKLDLCGVKVFWEKACIPPCRRVVSYPPSKNSF
jgi:hypothetical protein